MCTVISNESVNDQYKQLVLAAPEPALQAEPGQFFHLLCPQHDDLTPFLRRPMSVYRIDQDNNRLYFLYKITGAGTAAMSTLQPGDSFNVFGPLGRGFWLKPAWQNLLVVARGVGLATLAPLAQIAHREGRRLFAICSARSPEYLLSVEYFRELGARVHCVTDSDGSSNVPAVEKLIRDLIEQQGIDALFTCGSNRLLKLLQKLGREYNLPGEIALEQQMACGLGMCYCCVRTFVRDGKRVDLRVCKEGPVFDLQEAIAW
ncbi:MAG: dihydroorotate dehydrogenase electron transfer subunit [Chloroflexi bacterium]|nr:MAG: dihydroorotate dehydrogenase electron transfer subunit [Anaerolineaceae bacterium 4572_32.2]RLC75821.1 MAG: dihydroorotate dehydrogenase electron transfer subunit [Chloroflexota bacterium]RLC78801.1 MAG: dihydroorotate dehydrogenase electron transfer subunit [Chloroflexota bacterium]HEY73416.1 dihydroorotate dehydrogenase electron transfer subunit [Thermoflexia bacterium]